MACKAQPGRDGSGGGFCAGSSAFMAMLGILSILARSSMHDRHPGGRYCSPD
jgi:hypothetical protein